MLSSCTQISTASSVPQGVKWRTAYPRQPSAIRRPQPSVLRFLRSLLKNPSVCSVGQPSVLRRPLRSLRHFHRKIPADGSGQVALDFVVSRHRFLPTGRWVDPNRMIGPFPQETATMLLQMREKLASLHTAMETSSAAGSSLKASSLSVSRSSFTAALRSARQSSLVSP